ncbi:hypothetical protein F5146DRAFT_1006587 [Armillaria mellea]|nr:hypothetical protein F5146DRAFT_1006587 [Armillaria mellea]
MNYQQYKVIRSGFQAISYIMMELIGKIRRDQLQFFGLFPDADTENPYVREQHIRVRVCHRLRIVPKTLMMDGRGPAELPNVSLILVASQSGIFWAYLGHQIPYNIIAKHLPNDYLSVGTAQFMLLTQLVSQTPRVKQGYARRIDALNYRTSLTSHHRHPFPFSALFASASDNLTWPSLENLGLQALFHVEPEQMKLGAAAFSFTFSEPHFFIRLANGSQIALLLWKYQSAYQIQQVLVLGFGSTVLKYLYLGDDISGWFTAPGIIGVDMRTTSEMTPAASLAEHGGVIHNPSSVGASSNIVSDFPIGAASGKWTSANDTTGNLPSGDEFGDSTFSSDNSAISLFDNLLCDCTSYTA